MCMLGFGWFFLLEILNVCNILFLLEIVKLEGEINSLKEGWVSVI